MLKMCTVTVCSLTLVQSLMASPVTEEKNFNQPIQSMYMSTDEGNVVVHGHYNNDSSSIRVVANKFNAACRDSVKMNGDVLNIENYKKTGGCKTHYEIFVPSKIAVNIRNGASDVTINGITGQTNINNGAGNVISNDSKGPNNINLGAGNITVSYNIVPNVPIPVKAQVGSGSVTMVIPPHSRVNYFHNDSLVSQFNSEFKSTQSEYNFDAQLICSVGSVNIVASKK